MGHSVVNFDIRHLFLIFGQIVAMAKAIKNEPKKSRTSVNGKRGVTLSGVKEPVVQYSVRRESEPYNAKRLTYWLGMNSGNAKQVVTEFDILKLGTTGITKNAINTLATFIGISRKYITENIFNVSVKTLERKDHKTKLDKKTSSHAVEIARILQHGFEVFREEEKLKRWLNKENRALNNLKPVELFDTLSGLGMVNDVLGRIEEGVYS
jgi:putative toxin-antitoxin system antitoxin component (TIGR02293 family)